MPHWRAPSAATSNSRAPSRPWSTGSARPTWSLPAPATTSKPASFRFEADLLGVRDVGEVADHAADFSLLTRVTPQAPPFLIAHGDRDHVVAPSEGAALHDALSRAGADTRFMLLGGAGHEGAEFD